MNQACVTLEEVLAAATARAASVVSETSGYLTLALGDATARAPCAFDLRAVMLSTEGAVTLTRRGPSRPAEEVAEALRSLLARLLAVGTGTAMPSLAAAARPRDGASGVDGVIQEIEAALIPVNRAAARRALARLARETLRAKESGKLARATLIPEHSAPVSVAAPKPPPAPVVAEPVAVAPVVVTPDVAPPAAPVVAPLVVAPPITPPVVVVAPELAAPATVTTFVTEPARPAMVTAPLEPVLTPAPARLEAHAFEAPPMVEDKPGPALTLARRTQAAAPVVPSLPLLTALTPAPPGIVTAPSTDRTPTLLGIAPVEIDCDARTLVEARVSIVNETPVDMTATETPAPTPTGLAAVMALPTEDPAMAFELDEAPRPIPVAAAPVSAPAPPRSAPKPRVDCAPRPVEVRPTRADDLLARFGASCVDDLAMLETAARLRHMAGIDATPPPAPPVAEPAPSRALDAPADMDSRPPASVRVELPARQRSRSSLRGAALFVILGAASLGAAGAVRYEGELAGALARAREMLLPQPPAAPAPQAVEAPRAAPPTPTVTAAPVDRPIPTRAERGTTQRQR